MTYTYENPPFDVQKDIEYIYQQVIEKNGKRSNNYKSEQLKEPVIGFTIRYDNSGNPVSTARMLYRSCYDNSVRVFDRYALIEGTNGLLPVNYDGRFKKDSSDMLEQQTDFCKEKNFETIFLSIELRAKRTLERVIEGHNKYSKYTWKLDGPHYVTYKKSTGGLQYIGYTGRKFRRKDGLYYTGLEK